MTAQAYESAARDAAQLAAYTAQLGRGLADLSTRTTAAIGGTATGDDRAMTDQLSEISRRLTAASRAFADAAQAARRAAREAAEAEAQQARQAQQGRR